MIKTVFLTCVCLLSVCKNIVQANKRSAMHEAVPGDNVVLTCPYDQPRESYMVHSVRWDKTGTQRKNTFIAEKIHRTGGEKTVELKYDIVETTSLRIHAVDKSDTGLYRCTVFLSLNTENNTNSMEDVQLQGSTELYLRGDEASFTHTKYRYKTETFSGNTIVVECPRSVPENVFVYSVKWTKIDVQKKVTCIAEKMFGTGGAKAVADKYLIVNTTSLMINKVERFDTGVYHCTLYLAKYGNESTETQIEGEHELYVHVAAINSTKVVLEPAMSYNPVNGRQFTMIHTNTDVLPTQYGDYIALLCVILLLIIFSYKAFFKVPSIAKVNRGQKKWL